MWILGLKGIKSVKIVIVFMDLALRRFANCTSFFVFLVVNNDISIMVYTCTLPITTPKYCRNLFLPEFKKCCFLNAGFYFNDPYNEK